MFYTITNRDGQQTLSIVGETFEKVIASSHPNFETLVNYLVSTDPHDEEHVRDLVDPAVSIGRRLQEEFGDRVTFDLHHFYLDGIPETSALSKIVGDKVLAGEEGWMRLVRFLVRLDGNPSRKAKDAIWEWVEKHGVSITEDGRIAGFKGLVEGTDALTGETVPVSYHAGPNNFIDGVLYGEPGVHYQVPHRVGTVISKRRGDVDDDTSLACSTGLHVGAYSYAKTFGENREDGARYSTMGRMASTLPNSTFAIVLFAPEDVVSVPEDGTADWKIRVSKYEVSEFLEEVKDVLKGKVIYDTPTPAPFIPAGESYSPEPEVLPEVEDVEETSQEATSAPWKVVEHDGMGTTVLESFEDEDAANEALDGYIESEPEGDYEVQYIDPETGNVSDGPEDEEDDEEVEETAPEPSSDLTLAENADLVADLKRDLEDGSIGHKPLARKWSHLTTEASVRRYRKSQGVKISLGAKVKDAVS